MEALKASIEEGRQAIKEKGRNLLGLDLPHAENGYTIEPLPSEVPPVIEETEVIPNSYGNLPINETIPKKAVSLGTPEQQGEIAGEIQEPENAKEVSQPAPDQRLVTEMAISTKTQLPKLPRYIGPRPQTEEKETSNQPPYHEVQAGETLHGIAVKYNLDEKFLSWINKIADPTKIQVKQRIYLDESAKINADKEMKDVPPLRDIHTVAQGDSLTSISRQYGGRISVADLCEFNGLNAKSILQVGQVLALKKGVNVEEAKKRTIHVVRKGDTLIAIAKEHGVAVDVLKNLNDLSGTDIKIGQVLVIVQSDREKKGAEGLTGKEYTIYKINEYIEKRTKYSKIKCIITGKMIYESASKHQISPEFLTAILVNDSTLGTEGKGARNNNPGNVGQTDEKDAQGITVEGYNTIEEGVDACAENLSRRIRAFQNSYPGTELDISALVTNVGPDGKGFFLYEIGKNNPKKRGAYMTSRIGQRAVHD